jgi:hypothetical protein
LAIDGMDFGLGGCFDILNWPPQREDRYIQGEGVELLFPLENRLVSHCSDVVQDKIYLFHMPLEIFGLVRPGKI